MLTVVVPVYNGEEVIEGSVKKLLGHLKGRRYEIILGENGSTDRSKEICDRLAKKYGNVKTIHTEKGLGLALKALIEKARGEKIVYMPADLSVGMGFVGEADRLLDDYDIVVGSKRIGGAVDDRAFKRRIASLVFNSLVNLFLNLGVKDSQCTKGFRKSKILPLLEKTLDKGFFFEVELLYYAKRAGLTMKEVPVEVHDKGKSTVSVSKDSFNLFKKLLGFWARK